MLSEGGRAAVTHSGKEEYVHPTGHFLIIPFIVLMVTEWVEQPQPEDIVSKAQTPQG